MHIFYLAAPQSFQWLWLSNKVPFQKKSAHLYVYMVLDETKYRNHLNIKCMSSGPLPKGQNVYIRKTAIPKMLLMNLNVEVFLRQYCNTFRIKIRFWFFFEEIDMHKWHTQTHTYLLICYKRSALYVKCELVLAFEMSILNFVCMTITMRIIHICTHLGAQSLNGWLSTVAFRISLDLKISIQKFKMFTEWMNMGECAKWNEYAFRFRTHLRDCHHNVLFTWICHQ